MDTGLIKYVQVVVSTVMDRVVWTGKERMKKKERDEEEEQLLA